MRKTECAGNTASTMSFSARALSRSWPNGFSITTRRHGIGPVPAPVFSTPLMLGSDSPERLSCSTTIGKNFGAVSPGVVHYTGDLLFREQWLRPGLAPRDRSLVTVSALVATGQVAQITYHLNRAMDNGLTREQASEVLTHLAFYAGWPNVFSALPVVKDVFENRH